MYWESRNANKYLKDCPFTVNCIEEQSLPEGLSLGNIKKTLGPTLAWNIFSILVKIQDGYNWVKILRTVESCHIPASFLMKCYFNTSLKD